MNIVLLLVMNFSKRLDKVYRNGHNHYEQRATSNEQRATSNEQRATDSRQQEYSKNNSVNNFVSIFYSDCFFF